jgi:hypothetical protein
VQHRLWYLAVCIVGFLFGSEVIAFEGDAFAVDVIKLSDAPTLDGSAAEWSALGGRWIQLPTTAPSYIDSPSDLGDSASFQPRPELMAGIYQDRIYFAVRWHDERADTIYRRWIPRAGKYRRGRKRDDMLAFRFHTAGDFSACMLSGRAYTVDVWRWSAGRSQLAHTADDQQHIFSQTPVENAAEYQSEHGTLYIKKLTDEGDTGWHYAGRPKKGGQGIKLGVHLDGHKRGSRADVDANGVWSEGVWTNELSRKLVTGDPGDINFVMGESVTGQLAFFNPGYRMQKQITPILRLRMPSQ